MAKATKKIQKKAYNSDEWIDISEDAIIKETGSKDIIAVLSKSKRVKTETAIYKIA